MSSSLTVSLLGLTETNELFNNLRGFQIAAALKKAGQYTVESTKEGYKKQRDPSGTPWKKLNPAYKAWKASTGKWTSILKATGEMDRSLNWKLTTGMKCVVSFNGNRKKIAAKHQFGINVPRRVHLGFATFRRYKGYKDPEAIAKLFHNELLKQAGV